jgi:6-phosphogluconolactonase
MVIVRVHPDLTAVAEAGAALFAEKAAAAQAERGMFHVALSGGSTPKAMFRLLAAEPYLSGIDWSRVSVYWGDERAVGPKSTSSNYRTAREALLRHVKIPAAQIFRIEGERDPAAAAADYEARLRKAWPTAPFPPFDLVYLGMGEDGHTASLFPHSEVLTEEQAWVAAVHVPQLDAWRITLTPPAINAARMVVFLVAGADKAARVQSVLNREHHEHDQPAQMIHPQGVLLWLIDEAASRAKSR